jgi:diguanylate cyclase (GGDEF)-like protein/PAS domain S-box-containing protein
MSDIPKFSEEASDEISVLIKALLEVDQRIDELTEGQVDSVVDRNGRTFLLHRAQSENRYAEAAKQASILNALPAHVILLNTEGEIASVNAAWRRLRCTSTLLDRTYDVGTDYLARCDEHEGADAVDARRAAAGIRSVLSGRTPRFTLEYHFDFEAVSYWYLLSVTPLNEEHPAGAVVMHLDITDQKRREQRSRRFAVAMDAMADAVYLCDRATMRFVHVNDAACRLQNRTRRELMDAEPAEVMQVPLAELEVAFDQVIAAGESVKPIEFVREAPDGGRRWIEMRRHAHHSADGWTIISLERDVTERKLAEQRIAYLNRVYAMLSGINTLIVRIHVRDELFQEACRMAVEEGGFPLAVIAMFNPEVRALSPVGIFGRDPALVSAMREYFSSMAGDTTSTIAKQAIVERRVVISNDTAHDLQTSFGSTHPEFGIRSAAIFPIIVEQEVVGVMSLYAHESQFFHAEEVKLLTELANDIAFAVDHIGKQERLDYLAYYDLLTGLANRKLFLERVSQSLVSGPASGQKLALLLIDLRRFRDINDTLGRAAGDMLLKQVSEWLVANVGESNLLARVGVDQFALVLPEITQSRELARLLEKTMTAFLNHSFVLEGAPFRIAAVVGIALYPEDGTDTDTLFKHAEAALKKAKTGGDRYLFYNQKMSASLAGKLNLENQLHRALEHEEFELYYQPKMNLLDGTVSGAEALIRWNDPELGLILPGRFIPILEETGLIHEVGRWALRKAIQDFLRWRRAGYAPVRVAVNVSPLQLRSPSFLGEIEQVLDGNAYSAAGLELEITESLIMEDIKGNIATLRAICSMGVNIAIDDFGTGYSSLSYLAKLPVHTLKIDRSFITEMITGPEGLVLVSAIVKLAHSLDLKVVAEGVETEQQARLLRLLKCDEMQGYLMSKPMPCASFEAKYLTQTQAAADFK